MPRALHIRANGDAVTDTGATLGRVVALSRRRLEWHSPEGDIFADSFPAMKWELAGLYGCTVTASQWWEITA